MDGFILLEKAFAFDLECIVTKGQPINFYFIIYGAQSVQQNISSYIKYAELLTRNTSNGSLQDNGQFTGQLRRVVAKAQFTQIFE